MVSSFELAEEYSAKQNKLMRSVCSPLNRYFDVDYVGFQSVNKQGHYWGICNSPDMAQHIAQQQYHLDSPIIISPDYLSSAILHPNTLTHIAYFKHLTQNLKEQFGLKNIVVYITKKDDEVEIFSFATAKKTNPYVGSFVMNKSLVNRFIYSFRERTASLRAMAKEHYQDLTALKGECFGGVKRTSGLNLLNIDMDAFLQDIGAKIPNLQASDFTRRESQCIKAYIEGLTAQQTADFHGISKRTVEDYLNNVKQKLGINKKAQILNTLMDYDLLKYFKDESA